jgi:hypothetical protein
MFNEPVINKENAAINLLKSFLEIRLNNQSKMKAQDQNSNAYYIDYSIFSNDQLVTYLRLGLSELNQTLNTEFSFENINLTKYSDIIVESATINALSDYCVIEAGRGQEGSELARRIQEICNAMRGTHLTKLANLKDAYFIRTWDMIDNSPEAQKINQQVEQLAKEMRQKPLNKKDNSFLWTILGGVLFAGLAVSKSSAPKEKITKNE